MKLHAGRAHGPSEVLQRSTAPDWAPSDHTPLGIEDSLHGFGVARAETDPAMAFGRLPMIEKRDF